MYKGKRVRQSNGPRSREASPYLETGRQTPVRRPKRRRRRRKSILPVILTVILLIMIALIAVMAADLLSGDNIYGLWSIDGVTKYEFERNGKGALVLPIDRFDFTYTENEGRLVIDFQDDALSDSEYIYELQEDTMILNDANSAASYTLTRESD